MSTVSYHWISNEKIMTEFFKTGWRTGLVLSLAAAMMIVPEVILAGPGCTNNQRMAQGYYPCSPMAPQMAYRQSASHSYYPAPAPYAGRMAAPYNRSMTARQSKPAIVGKPAAVATSAGQSSQSGASSMNMPAGDTVSVRINGMRFEPANITVKPGTTVTWIDESQMPHTVSGQSGGLRSSTLYNGQKFGHTFDHAGRYDYLCDLHPSMKGSVVVEDAARDS